MEQKQNLLDQENMKSFLQLLEENGMHDEKLSVQLLAGYVDQMEFQFNTVLEELKSVRQELNTIQDKTLRATASRAVDKVVTKVEDSLGLDGFCSSGTLETGVETSDKKIPSVK